jgi:4-amino-4-deoxy-L-arabinose transferase-like glycosyltransferase
MNSVVHVVPAGAFPAAGNVWRLVATRAAAPLGLLILCAVWIFATLVGHDPWKPDEAYSFGIVLDFMERGDWIVPMLSGEPFLEKPPLFFITASAFARIFGELLPLHDAARLATGFYVILALLFLAMTARELHRGRHGWTVVLVMLGCLGLVVRAHQLVTDLALLAGISIGMFGLAYARRAPIGGGLALGAGATIAFLSKGLIGPGLLALAALILPIFATWRQPTYVRTLTVAAIVALPAIATWPIALYLRSPELFRTWLITNNFDRFLGLTKIGPHQPPFFYSYTLLWYALPALPLAAWSLWDAYRCRTPARSSSGIQMPLAVFLVMIGVLGMAAHARELYLMPALLPLSLLAVVGIERLPPAAAAVLANTAKVAFSVLALGLWLGWVSLLTDRPLGLATRLAEFQPGFVANFSWLAFVVALLATITWFILIWPRAVSAQRAIVQWTAGVTVCLSLVAALWLPYIDAGKSYRGMIASLIEFIPDNGCVASRNLGEPQRAMLQYFGHIKAVRDESAAGAVCNALIVQGWYASGAPARDRAWTLVWEGARPGDQKELYRMYVRGVPDVTQPARFPANELTTISLPAQRRPASLHAQHSD